jgi:hypothetical protein
LACSLLNAAFNCEATCPKDVAHEAGRARDRRWVGVICSGERLKANPNA